MTSAPSHGKPSGRPVTWNLRGKSSLISSLRANSLSPVRFSSLHDAFTCLLRLKHDDVRALVHSCIDAVSIVLPSWKGLKSACKDQRFVSGDVSPRNSDFEMPLIPLEISERLRCPLCSSPFSEREGGLECANRHMMPLKDGYLEAPPLTLDRLTNRTFESFGYEWNVFDKIRSEDKQFWSRYFADVPLPEIEGKVGLDAGCGKGRFAVFTAPHLSALVALDGSDAVRAAVRNLAGIPNVLVVRSDLRNAPFAPSSFDFIYCLGVLHHLSNAEEAFNTLVDLLVPGGLLLVYVYSQADNPGLRRLSLDSAAVIRKITVRLPFKAVQLLSLPIAFVLYVAFVLPGHLGDRVRIRALSRLPLQPYRGKPFRSLLLDTFDRLTAPHETRYSWGELESWFQHSPVTVVAAREEAGWYVLLKKATESSSGTAGEELRQNGT